MKHYQKNFENMILRDYLALDRTKLANERTFLGYIRTFISILLSGVGFVQFVDIEAVKYLGFVLCFISPIFFIVGIWKYFSMRKGIKKLEENGS